MQKQKMTWRDFVLRRRLNVSEWLKNKRFTTHLDIEAWCRKNDIEPPSKEESEQWLNPIIEVGPSDEPFIVESLEDLEAFVEPPVVIFVEEIKEEDKPKRGRKKKEESSES